ncbi:hypothetical protein MKX03_033057 [Papaver bracteatum]|nr:hypothetical protein MKX03_033057 [Papaver bracteatum]
MTSNVGVTSFLLVFGTSFALVPDNVDAYPNWAASRKFKVGDTLGKPLNFCPRIIEIVYRNSAVQSSNFSLHICFAVFNFETGQHDLAEVSKEEFDNCTATNQTSIIRQGPANINLTSICPHYFICTIGKHCQFGQKLTINVTDDSATKTPSGFPPTTATAPAPVPTTPANSASHTATGSFALILLFISTILLH